MAKRILALPGDGAGPELISSATSVISAATQEVDIVFGDIGTAAYKKTERYLPQETMDLAVESDAIIAGEVTKRPNDIRYRDPLKVLKKQLNLYAIMRKFYPLCDRIGTKGVDLMIMTGNPDSLLNIIEKENLDGVVAEKFISSDNCKNLFKLTMKMAEIKGRHNIMCAHMSEMFPFSDGMFVDLFYKELAASEFILNDEQVDSIASKLILDPASLDVLVCTDIYGTTLAGIAAGLVGGAHLTPVGSIGNTQGMFEPMRRPALDTVGGIVNPTSAILSGAMAMDQIGMPRIGENIRIAVRTVYKNGDVTPDVGGKSTAKEFTDSVIKVLKNNS